MDNEKIKSYKDLNTWKNGHELVLQIYKITKKFPKEEQFGLVSQICRAAVSITSNIAEGFSRRLPKDKAHFYSMAKGSLTEVDNQILIAKDVGYINDSDFNKIGSQIEIVGRLLTGLLKVTQHSKFNIQNSSQQGFSLVEVILASAVFVLLVTAFVGAYLYGQESTALAGSRARATFLVEEGLEAVRNIRDSSFENLIDGTYGLATTSNQWNLSGSSDTVGVFTRQITVATVDENRKTVSCSVSWQQNPQRNGSVSLTSRLTNWQKSASTPVSCNEHTIQEGYSAGTCRANSQQCANNGETYLSTGDVYCTDGASVDTCCALP
ncbi:MAG: four helix bundle protein [Patescibacteria group bacterium]|nr:four helix bundle protein [Patescibacteria group bacterium]